MALFFRNRMGLQRRKDAALDLMVRARGILNADEDAVVSVSEHDCGDPGCRGARTVILIMRPDQPTKAIKIDKPLEAVTVADLSDALAPLACMSDAPIRRSSRRSGRF